MVISTAQAMRRTAALILLCAGLLGRLFLHVSLESLLLGATFLVAIAALRQIWLAEREYRVRELERDGHFLREREFASAQRRERGD